MGLYPTHQEDDLDLHVPLSMAMIRSVVDMWSVEGRTSPVVWLKIGASLDINHD